MFQSTQKLRNVMTPDEKKAFYKELLSLAIPIGLQSLLVALIGATDAFMLGRLAQDAVSAVSLANQIVFIMNLFIGAVVGAGGTLISQYWGKNDKTMVKNLFCMILKGSLALSFVFFALAMFMPEKLMRIYTPDAELIRIGASYLRAVSVSYLFTALTQCYYLKMKVEGHASKSVLISVFVLILDMVLDLFLIYGLAGVPALGANGSAYSTVAVELLALVWCIAESHRKDRIRPDWQGLKWFSAAVTRDWGKIALPMLSSGLAWGIGFSMHSLIMGHWGSDATAAASITALVLELITCICKGVSAGTGIILGKLLGQDLFDRARIYARKFCHLSFAIGAFHMLLSCLIAPLVMKYFVLSDTARQYLLFMMIFNGLYSFAYSINTIVVCGVFPAGGDARYDAVSVFFASWCFSLPLALLGTFVFRWPVMLVYILMNLDEIVKLPWIYPHYKKEKWVRNLTREGE